MSARLSGRAKGTRGSVSVTVNRHEELSDRSAPYADFGHGSLFEAAPGARQFGGAAESPTKSLFMPIEICKEHGGLHAYFNRREAAPSGAASGHAKPPSSGQAAPSLDLGVRCGPPNTGTQSTMSTVFHCVWRVCGTWNRHRPYPRGHGTDMRQKRHRVTASHKNTQANKRTATRQQRLRRAEGTQQHERPPRASAPPPVSARRCALAHIHSNPHNPLALASARDERAHAPIRLRCVEAAESDEEVDLVMTLARGRCLPPQAGER